MCLLIVARGRVTGYPVVVAANRDERLSRPWRGPETIEGDPPIICPRDEEAGGTWIGVNGAGLVVAITNRGRPTREGLRSRGLLCLEALGVVSARRAADAVGACVREESHNGFHLAVADREAGWLLAYDGRSLDEQPIGEGVHVLTNLHSPNPPELEDVRRAAEESARGGREAFEETVRSLLSDHRAAPSGYAPCKHGDRHGTVCATLVWLPVKGRPIFDFAPGPPCRTPFATVPVPFELA